MTMSSGDEKGGASSNEDRAIIREVVSAPLYLHLVARQQHEIHSSHECHLIIIKKDQTTDYSRKTVCLSIYLYVCLPFTTE